MSTISWASSSLLRIEIMRTEIMRTVTRATPSLASAADDLLHAFTYVGIDAAIVEKAMNEPGRKLRSLDAIHLATACTFGTELDAFMT